MDSKGWRTLRGMDFEKAASNINRAGKLGVSMADLEKGMAPAREAFKAIDAAITAAVKQQYRKDEERARAVILARFPRTGPWLVEHPRALRLIFRLRPSLRPEMIVWP